VEDRAVRAWRERTNDLVDLALTRLDPAPTGGAEHVAADAPTWREALDEPGWQEGDVLVVGSSTSQSLASRVFLGSTATRIIRHSPVPVMVIP
jgi:nucleotide-binding universal stress UspA family protein